VTKGKTSLPIERINALAELERWEWKYEPLGNNEVKICCPVHEDKSPSVNLDVEQNLWKCHVCPARGDIVSLIAAIASRTSGKQIERGTVINELSSRYDLESIKVLSQDVVEKHHASIWEAGPLLQALYDRGITDADIREARLGYWEGRISIPVYDEHWNVVNIRRYLPGAPGPDKMRNMKGYGRPARMYQVADLKYEKVWLCGGELKARVAKRLLNPHGIGAVALTEGEGNWEHKYSQKFKDKIVYICYDIDAVGFHNSRKVAGYLARFAKGVFLIRLPLDAQKYPKGDINDYVGQEHATDVDLVRLMSEATAYVPDDPATPEDTSSVRRVKLVDATRPENVGHRLEMDGTVNAMEETPYLIPRTIGCACDRNQPECTRCPVLPMDPHPDTGKVVLKIRGTSMGMLNMVGSPEKLQRESIRESLGIPTCKSVSFTVQDHFNVWDVRLTPQLTISGSNADNVNMPALVVSEEIDLNVPYVLQGRIYPHPKNQQAILVIDDVKQAEDSLNSFAPTASELETLKVFQPAEWTTKGIKEKLDEFYADIEFNVTRIYHRRNLHVLMDLVYHSALYFYFDGRLQNGWVNALVAGDTSQGKSEATTRLMGHYGVGERVECKNATVPGLLGGFENLGNKMFVKWGAVPTHDRRFVVLEEVNGAPVEVIGKLTDMRSSGIAELQKVGGVRRAHARTRQLWTGNSRSNRRVSQFNFGVELLQELIGSAQDVRRFDVAMVVSKADVDPKEINKAQEDRPNVEPKFTPELCRRRVLWAWTRSPAQIVFDKEAERACLEAASAMCGRYSEEIPLVDKGTMRFKIARLAVSCAACTFSTGDTVESVRVQQCHVEFVSKWLEKLYASPTLGYADFSRAMQYCHQIKDPQIVESHIRAQKFPRDFVDNLLHSKEVTLNDIMDWCEIDKDSAQKVLSLLVRKNALYRDGRFYAKTPTFITLLKHLQQADLPENNIQKEKFA
jgi:hypothetical protein